MKQRSPMNWNARNLLSAASLSVCLFTQAAFAQAAFVQEPKKPDFPRMDEVLNGTSGQTQESAEARMRRLFGEVETKLRHVDVLLTDAAAGETKSLAQAEEAGISKLLRSSLDRGRAAQADIQEILEIARQMASQSKSPSSSGSSGQGQKPQSGEGSPLDKGGKSQTPESTPELPGAEPKGKQPSEKPGGEENQPDGEQPDGEDPNGDEPNGEQPDGRDPKSPTGDPNRDGENRSGDENGADAQGGQSNSGGDDGWGNLPTHVRDTFRSEGRSEMPARYRDWIDEYYRKLNKRGPKR